MVALIFLLVIVAVSGRWVPIGNFTGQEAVD
jgi:hypothetical protein